MTKDEWDKLQKQYEQEVSQIVIPEWPTESEIKQLSAKIDKVFTRVLFDMGRARVANDDIDRLIDKTLKLNLIGNNDSERKRASMQAVVEYFMPNGQKTDLYEIQKETNKRLVFMETTVRALDTKMRILTIVYGTIKIESGMNR